MSTRFSPAQILFALAALLALGLVLAGVIPARFSFDDTYITARNAWLLAHGLRDTAFDTAALTGSSSTLHTLLVALFARFTDAASATMTVVVLTCWLYAAAAWHATQRLELDRNALAGFILLCTGGLTLFHLVNGLDTGLTMAASLALLCLLLSRSASSAIWAAALAGLCIHIRLELAALALPVLACKAWDNRSSKLAGLPVLFWMALAGLLASLPLIAFVHAATGHLLPHTWQAKSAFYADTCHPLFQRLLLTLQNGGLILLSLMPVSLGLLFPSRSRAYACVAFYTLAFVAAYALFMPSSFSLLSNSGRYVYPLVPGWAFLFLAAYAPRQAAKTSRPLLLVALGTLLLSLLFTTQVAGPRYTNLQALEETAAWATAHIPNGSRIVLIDAGYVPLATQDRNFRLTDLVGLKSPWVMGVHQRITEKTCQRDPALLEVIRTARPDWAILPGDWCCDNLPALLAQAGYTPVLEKTAGYVHIYRLTPVR